MLENLKTEFITASKRILKENISTNPEKLAEYKHDIIEAYNKCIDYVNNKWQSLDTSVQTSVYADLTYLKRKLTDCLNKLNLNFELPSNILSRVEEENIIEEVNTEEENIICNIENSESRIMAITNVEFLRLCGETIPNIYTGEPLGLLPFLNAIELLVQIADTDNLRNLLISFVKTRMNGKAIEYLPVNNVSIASIIEALKKHIKPENDKVIRGKMAALRTDRISLTEFTKQAENLADSLKRALILDGIPNQKANQMAIDETINTCKLSSKTNYVKSVLASTAFASPKEVVAKFIVESNNEVAEKQVLSFRSFPQKYQNKNFNNFNKNKPQSQFRNRNPSNFQNKYYKKHNYNESRPFNRNDNRRNVRVTRAENEETPSHQGETKQMHQVQEI